MRDRNKENSEKPWFTALNELRLSKIQEHCDEIGVEEIMVYLMNVYDTFFQIAASRNELELMTGFVGQVCVQICFLNTLFNYY